MYRVLYFSRCCWNVWRRDGLKKYNDMTHITIRLSSPPAGSKNIREIIRIKTPEKMLSLDDKTLVEAEEDNLKRADTCFNGAKEQVTVCGSSQDLLARDSLHTRAEEKYVYTNCNTGKEDPKCLISLVNTDIDHGRGETVVTNGKKTGLHLQGNSCSQTSCDSCGRPIARDELESELYITRKDLATVQNQLETFKSRLEEELIERFKLEEELKSEAEVHECEMKVLREKIESLEEIECEKTKRVEELEKMLLVYKEEYEKCLADVEELRTFVGKYQSDVCKLRAQANLASDQAVEAINEMEVLTKKTEKSEHEKERVRKQLKSEMEGCWKEVRELRTALENWEKLDAERKSRIQTLENEVASYKDQVNELREQLTECSNERSEGGSKMDHNKSEHLLMLCHELNEIFREHLNSQGKFSELSFVLTATQKELEEARNRSQQQNLALEEFKQKYNDLHDNMLALGEENRHLRNSLEQKCADFRDIRRKFLVSETEVSWLKEALNIVDNAKKKSVCTNAMETSS